MAKNNKKAEEAEKSEVTAPEMTLAESRAYRASLHSPKAAELSEEDSREEFRKFWAQQKSKHSKLSGLEEIVWLHLKAVKKASPAQFEEGLAHFGFKS